MAAAVLSPVTDASGGTSKSSPNDMESKPNGAPLGVLRPILKVASQADFAEAMKQRRLEMGLTQMELDHIAGFHDGYSARLETPFTRTGKKSFKLTPMATIWLSALGVRLALVSTTCMPSAVSDRDTNQTSLTYGQPLMYQFAESAVGQAQQPRQFTIHPDRVIIVSRDGTLNGRSALEPGYNALLDMEKIRGGGGEGFWKNAKSGLSLEIEKDAKIEDMARVMGVQVQEVVDKIDEQVESFNKGFDKSLMMQGIKAVPIQVQLLSPEHFFAIALQSFAATFSCPLKILVGAQTGERASTEDSEEWARVNMARRTNELIPAIMAFVNRLERFGILPQKDWRLDWTDLTESSMGEKIDRADKMASVNQKMGGEIVFTGDDIRGVVGMEPLSDAEKFRDDDVDDEEAAAGLEPDDDSAPAA